MSECERVLELGCKPSTLGLQPNVRASGNPDLFWQGRSLNALLNQRGVNTDG